MKLAVSFVVSSLVVVLAGCGEPPCDGLDCGHDHDHGHAHHAVHPSEGPHQGRLVELGHDEYHAEWLIDEAVQSLTVYVLDGQALNAIGADASATKINLVHDGSAKQYRLSAQPQMFDAPGKASRFVSSDAEICHEVEHAHAQLVVSIRGKQYRGTIEAEHHEASHKSILVK